MQKIIQGIIFLLVTSLCWNSTGFAEFTESTTKTLPTEEFEIILIRASRNISGDLQVFSDRNRSRQIKINYIGKAKDQTEFNWFVNLVDIDIETSQDKAIVDISTPDHAPWEDIDRSMVINLDFYLPSDKTIRVSGRFHNILVEGPFAGLEINNDYGEVMAKSIKGKTNIRTSHKNVNLENVDGAVNILNNHGNIRASRINAQGNLCRFETTAGTIELDEVKGEVVAITSHNDILLNNIDAGDGKISAANNYGAIELYEVTGRIEATTKYNTIDGNGINFAPGVNEITGGFDPIDLTEVTFNKSKLSISNNFSDVSLGMDAAPSVHVILATNEGGAIYTSGLPLKPVGIERNRFEGVSGDGTSELQVNIIGIGRIEVYGESGIAY
ncbi:MAG: hypothetical protein GF315_13335 [candidate division Zixibacteria bacterium]|nr:hypothetical protein [candidate division Zixibacteria bacterium]